ncbi:protein of unknown function [Oenococcus oeni]|uniref:YvbJ-like NTF2-like domain-containing protein n=1 Tax=Oenococcus oeni TaxID=1247 RepID=A0AAQ2ZEH0_OENOE|nr:hypothetical protein [Oenococcus oeni]SYW05245.1 hypothetical protein OENI_120014 [Oenococcus oeni]VDB98800.1 protein of unknown function [Oenococcus oeni]
MDAKKWRDNYQKKHGGETPSLAEFNQAIKDGIITTSEEKQSDSSSNNASQLKADKSKATNKLKKKGNNILSPKKLVKNPITYIIGLIAIFLIFGLLTNRTQSELESAYKSAIVSDNSKRLLSLFPKSQTKSPLAKDGADSYIQSIGSDGADSSWDSIVNNDGHISIKSTNYLIFFHRYELTTVTSKLVLSSANQNKVKITYKGKSLTKKDIEKPLFPGTYNFKIALKNEFGTSKGTTTIVAGEGSTVKLNYGNINGSEITLPKGPTNIAVSYKGKNVAKLSSSKQKLGPIPGSNSSAKKNLKLSGNFGKIVTLDKPSLYAVENNDTSSTDYFDTSDSSISDGYVVPAGHVTISKNLVQSSLNSFAPQLFSAYQNSDSSVIKSADKKFKDVFSSDNEDVQNSDDTKNTYKSVEFKPDNVIFSFNANGAYLEIPFTVNYTETYTDESDSDPSDENFTQDVIFKINSDGSLTAHNVGDSSDY